MVRLRMLGIYAGCNMTAWVITTDGRKCFGWQDVWISRQTNEMLDGWMFSQAKMGF